MKDQVLYYQNKLAFETDSADVFDALQKNDKIKIIDARKEQA